MTQILYRPKEEMTMFVVDTDSMGRTPDQVEAMEKNEIKPHRLSKRDKAYAETVAKTRASYPKVLYKLALKKGVPAGDEAAPSYPMPHDLAQSLNLTDKNYKVLGKTRDSGGYILIRHPYITTSVGVYVNDDKNGMIDFEESIKLEKKLIAQGWVDDPNKIVGLPAEQPEEEFDPVPLPEQKAIKAQPRA